MNNYRREIDQIRDTSRSGALDLLAQLVLIGIGVIVAWQMLGLWQLPVWFAVTYSIICFEKYLHSRPLQHYSRRRYFSYLGLGATTTVIASYLPLFLWFQGGEPFHFAAMAYLLGATLNTFLVHSRSWQLMVCYAGPNAIVLCIIAVSYFVRSGFSTQGYITLLIAVLISSYFGVSVWHAIRRRRRDDATQERLLRAQKMETLGNLSGGIAHDFNNILMVISGNLELLQYATSDDEREQLAAQALSATERSAGLVRQLLAFGRQSQLSPEAVNIGELFDELQVMVKRLVPTYINVTFDADSDLDAIWIDKSTLQATLINLVTNARDAMQSSGEILIRAQLTHVQSSGLDISTGRLDAGDYIEFTVRDSGTGISPDVFGRVLEPFFTTKEVGAGAGLGLSMVAGFARQSSGGVDIASTVDAGTCVSLYVPNVAPPELATTNTQESKTGTPLADQQTQILLVEDEPKLRAILKAHLQKEGFVVLAVENGDAALRCVDEGYYPKVVLTDVVMPGHLQGVELVKALQPRAPDATFIVMTGYSYSKEQELAAANLEYSMISKPFKLDELTALITKASGL
ncbi:MAG: response regulator [Pseudomonadota bacterium]